MRGMKSLEYLSASPWAIRPEMMEVGRSLLLGETTFSPEMVKAREGRPMDGTAGVTVRNGVAVIDIVGPIFRYADFFTAMCGGATVESLAQDLQSALANSNVSAILLHIDSPGGQAAGIGELAGMIREGTTKKPIVAYVGSEGASAAYWLASAASEIVAAPSALLGSIGVVMAYPRKKDDPKSIEFVSSQSPMKRPDVSTPDGREEIQGTVDAMAKVFIDSVAEYRATNPEKVAADFGKGGIKIGADAVAAGMADRLGTFEGVLAQLSAGYSPATPTKAPAHVPNPREGKPTPRPATASSAPSSLSKRGAHMAKPNWLTKFLGGGLSAAAEAGEPIDFEAVARMQRAAVEPAPEPTVTLSGNTFEARTFDIEADPKFKAMKAQLEAATAAAKATAESEAATFVTSLIKSDRLLPAQEADAKSLLAQLASDDRANPVNGFSRFAVGKRLLDGNAKHGLTTDVVADENGEPKLPAGQRVLPQSNAKDPSKPYTAEELRKVMALTDEGRAVAERLGK